MKFHLFLVIVALGSVGCANGLKLVRTPPGTSVEVALAKKAELVRLPGPPPPPPGTLVARQTRVPAVEPDLPSMDKTELIADAYSRGQFCMETGADAEAIVAFREAVKLDPKFFDAWQRLAALYERQGDQEKAVEAFRNAKKMAGQQSSHFQPESAGVNPVLDFP